ncbi:VOC family protein [Tenggerimyces flavus]|uniref:VOC family protein n=1 Tax=Tenggerimyces flavus TaxID=1708749 RepID=A0ABV7YA99_9ACTN|nr:VOC family protein [Tenggerimyces flavus]MBM7789093.1 catechol 2,3-dioxygenase-like lactoylglutathione lyase family enzyme [Tenggerimyces flavus]
MIYELNHVGMRIRDLSASLAFYVDQLGAVIVDELFVANGQTDRVHIQLAGGLIELLHPHQPGPDVTWGVDHIGFMTDDLDGDHARLVSRGFTFSTPPKVAGSGQGRLAFLSDPNGVRVELLQRSEEFRVPPIEGPVQALAHISLSAPNLEEAVTFYRDDLGMSLVETDGTGTYLRHQNDTIELVNTTSDRPIRGLTLRIDSPANGPLTDPDGTRIDLIAAGEGRSPRR